VKTATISEAQSELTALIELVREGETVVITDEGRPVARLIPAPRADRLSVEEEEARLDRLERAGVIRRGTGVMPVLEPFPEPIVPSGVLDALLKERRTGR
jgi:prevent-host-death family protein